MWEVSLKMHAKLWMIGDVLTLLKSLLLHGLRIKDVRIAKTDYTSIGDEVNPEFLSVLKKATLAYLTVLASKWKLKELDFYDKHYDFKPSEVEALQKRFNEEVEIKKLCRENDNKMRAPHCVLDRIAWNCHFRQQIVISGCKIYSKWEYLEQFSNILRMESLNCNPLHLSIIASRYIIDELPAYQNSKKYKTLPKVCEDMVNDEKCFCIKKI